MILTFPTRNPLPDYLLTQLFHDTLTFDTSLAKRLISLLHSQGVVSEAVYLRLFAMSERGTV